MISSLLAGIKARFTPNAPREKELRDSEYNRVSRVLDSMQALKEGKTFDDTDFLYLMASLKGWEAPRMQEIRSMLVNQGYWRSFHNGRSYMTNGVIQIGVYGDPYGLSDKYLSGSRVDLDISMVNPRKRASVLKCLGNQPILDTTTVERTLSWYN
jgi:hypothetical protein